MFIDIVIGIAIAIGLILFFALWGGGQLAVVTG